MQQGLHRGVAPAKTTTTTEGSRVRLALAGSFTAEPSRAYLEFWATRLGWSLDLAFAPYNQVFQELLTPGSTISDPRLDARILLLSWDDLVPVQGEAQSSAWLERVERVARELRQALSVAVERTPGNWLVVLARSARGHHDVELTVARLQEVERELESASASLPGVRVVTSDWIDRRYPVRRWHDPDAEKAGQIPYTDEYFAALGTVVARAVYASRHPARKVLVLDCDQTLWGGVVGEDGPASVSLGTPFAEVQASAARLAAEGRLVCLVSKNRLEDVRAVFDQRDDMRLPWNDVVAHRVNWDSKPENVESLARELNLSLDAFVFVDDNPLECAAVAASLPEVLSLTLPRDPDTAARFVDHLWVLDGGRVTSEDRARTAMYRAEREREAKRSDAPTLAEFLRSLDLRVDIARVSEADVARASQLTIRTNQFNSTTVRRSETEIRALLADPGVLCMRVSVSDRFGDYGTVGLVSARPSEDCLDVDSIMLSCRALARGVEHHMVRHLGDEANALGLRSIRLRFSPSERNEPMARFLREIAESAQMTWSGTGDLDVPVTVASSLQPRQVVATPPDDRKRPLRKAEASGIADVALWEDVAVRWSSPSAVAAEIASQVAPRPDIHSAYVEPRTDTERTIARAWREVLRLEHVGVDDRFTDLGGASVQLVRVLSRLRHETGHSLEITTLLQHPTVRSLAAHLDGSRGHDRLGTVERRGNRQREAFAAARRHPGRRSRD